jgi:hypothetical protein
MKRHSVNGANVPNTEYVLTRATRAKFIKNKIGKNACFITQVLVRAMASDLSGNAFRVLSVLAAYADPDGTNAFPSHQTIAHICGFGVRTSERAIEELGKLGWIDTERRGRGSNSIAIRSLQIPGEQAASQRRPAQELSNLRGRGAHGSKFKNRQIRRPRTVTDGGLPTTIDLSVIEGERLNGRPRPEVVGFDLARANCGGAA